MIDWKPIETAPKDGSRVLLGCPLGWCVGIWVAYWNYGKGDWLVTGRDRIWTHWAPINLPEDT